MTTSILTDSALGVAERDFVFSSFLYAILINTLFQENLDLVTIIHYLKNCNDNSEKKIRYNSEIVVWT